MSGLSKIKFMHFLLVVVFCHLFLLLLTKKPFVSRFPYKFLHFEFVTKHRLRLRNRFSSLHFLAQFADLEVDLDQSE